MRFTLKKSINVGRTLCKPLTPYIPIVLPKYMGVVCKGPYWLPSLLVLVVV